MNNEPFHLSALLNKLDDSTRLQILVEFSLSGERKTLTTSSNPTSQNTVKIPYGIFGNSNC